MKDLHLKKSERSFLADQAADAKTAMTGTLRDMKDTLTRVADVRSCAKQHPWLAVGWAVAAGFVTGAVLTSAQRKTIKTTGASIEAEPQPSCHGQETPRSKNSFLFSTVVTVLSAIFQTVVKSLIAAAVVAKVQPQVETRSPHESTAKVEPNA
jgi:uncharacterized membrane protein YoaK (UPF0700 family)